MADAPVRLCFRHHQEPITRESGITDAMQFAAVNLIAGCYNSGERRNPQRRGSSNTGGERPQRTAKRTGLTQCRHRRKMGLDGAPDMASGRMEGPPPRKRRGFHRGKKKQGK